jgi:hypothetical protein
MLKAFALLFHIPSSLPENRKNMQKYAVGVSLDFCRADWV